VVLVLGRVLIPDVEEAAGKDASHKLAVRFAGIRRNRELLKAVLPIALCAVLTSIVSCSKNSVNIHSYILRNRVVVLDQVLMKKALYVSFSFSGRIKQHENLNVHGLLLKRNKIVSETFLQAFREKNGNLVFDLPYEISDGKYTIKIDVLANNGGLAGTGSVAVERSALKRYFDAGGKIAVPVLEEISVNKEREEVEPTDRDKSTGYILFSRSPLRYVFPNSRPKKSEMIDHLAIQAVRNEFEPITFSLYPLRNLGSVKISVTDLKSAKSTISKDKMRVAYVEAVRETIGLPEGKFENLPALIRTGNQVGTQPGKCQRFWLTIRTDDSILPGIYEGKITISPEIGVEASLPLKVTIAPISLEDIPGIDYFMMMTYEFTELTMPWTKEEKEKIYQSACDVLKSYKEHGMTTICVHSPFVLMTNKDGTPNLEDIFAALRAAKEMGFKRRIIWYMGHLIQTSKPKHPGSIMGFDKEIDLPRLKYIVKTVSQYAKEHGCPEVIFLPIDEPGDSYQDLEYKRHAITPLLLEAIKEAGAPNMLTGGDYKQFRPIDYFCSGKVNKEDLSAAHESGTVYWLYNNDVTTRCLNPAYARYVYGYYTWMNHVDGMSSWTFQNTQNAGGLPGQADVHGSDIYLAYPDPRGPMPTLKWEAIREGIEDHKLVYQLVKRIRKLKRMGIHTSKYEDFLLEISKKKGSPLCLKGEDETWSPIFFRKNRDRLISMILDAEAKAN
jgi:hypothetical protein